MSSQAITVTLSHHYVCGAIVLFLTLHSSKLKSGSAMNMHFQVQRSTFTPSPQVLISIRYQPHIVWVISVTSSHLPSHSWILNEYQLSKKYVLAWQGRKVTWASASPPIAWSLDQIAGFQLQSWLSVPTLLNKLEWIQGYSFNSFSLTPWYIEKLCQVGEKRVEQQLAAGNFIIISQKSTFSLPTLLDMWTSLATRSPWKGLSNAELDVLPGPFSSNILSPEIFSLFLFI